MNKPKIIYIMSRFSDNKNKYKKRIVFHWTASATAKSAIDWLDGRIGGKGTVAYNFIIDKNGDVYDLLPPQNGWFHNTGLGGKYDKDVIAIAFVNEGNGKFTDKQYDAAKYLLKRLNEDFTIIGITHHHTIYPHKPDFPEEIWEEVKERLGI